MGRANRVVRSYRIDTAANETKLDAIREILPHWQRGLVHVQLLQVRRLQSGIPLGWLGGTDAAALPGYLSQRQWKSVVNQVNGALRSWQGLAQLEFTRQLRVMGSELSERDRLALLRVNARSAWWATSEQLRSGRAPLEVPDEVLGLARRIMRVVLRRVPFPYLAACRTMWMDAPIASMERARGAGFTRWLKVATLQRGKPVLVPVRDSDYFLDREGQECNFTQVVVAQDGTVEFSRVKMRERAEARVGREVGLDWGLAALVATSDGELHGRGLHRWLRERDAELVTLQQALTRNGVRPRDSKRWRRLNKRIRDHVANEIGRILNTIAGDETIAALVVEHLDFRGRSFSRAMSRILSRAGRAAFARKLQDLEELSGIETVPVNPAHTSRQCSGCGYTDQANRTSQSRFRCRFCGKSSHADVDAARVIRQRRSLSDDGLVHASTVEVLAILDSDFASRWGCSAAEVRQRHTRGRSTATSAVSAA